MISHTGLSLTAIWSHIGLQQGAWWPADMQSSAGLAELQQTPHSQSSSAQQVPGTKVPPENDQKKKHLLSTAILKL